MTAAALMEAIGQAAVGIMLVVLGLLSKRLGSATHAKPRYSFFYLAAVLVFAGCAIRLLNAIYEWASPEMLHASLEWVLLYTGLPAAGITLGVIMSWHYWSWLLAERD